MLLLCCNYTTNSSVAGENKIYLRKKLTHQLRKKKLLHSKKMMLNKFIVQKILSPRRTLKFKYFSFHYNCFEKLPAGPCRYNKETTYYFKELHL